MNCPHINQRVKLIRDISDDSREKWLRSGAAGIVVRVKIFPSFSETEFDKLLDFLLRGESCVVDMECVKECCVLLVIHLNVQSLFLESFLVRRPLPRGFVWQNETSCLFCECVLICIKLNK